MCISLPDGYLKTLTNILLKYKLKHLKSILNWKFDVISNTNYTEFYLSIISQSLKERYTRGISLINRLFIFTYGWSICVILNIFQSLHTQMFMLTVRDIWIAESPPSTNPKLAPIDLYLVYAVKFKKLKITSKSREINHLRKCYYQYYRFLYN